jgi:hypothetical protein
MWIGCGVRLNASEREEVWSNRPVRTDDRGTGSRGRASRGRMGRDNLGKDGLEGADSRVASRPMGRRRARTRGGLGGVEARSGLEIRATSATCSGRVEERVESRIVT